MYFSSVPEGMSYEDIITRCINGFSLCKNQFEGKSCNSPRTNVRVEVMESCWLIDIDISVIFPRRENNLIPLIPMDIMVGDVPFRLAGVILYSGLHYVSLIPHRGKWVHYDGMGQDRQNE
ncbi:hypothetical protein PFISCL1PPCAC_18384, partial [Pristionchus fissidentatus]